jgi:hypothetical protein
MIKEERAIAGDFLKYLQETCPVPSAKISMTCYNLHRIFSPTLGGGVSGRVLVCEDGRCVIKVATLNRSRAQILTTIGHEYWHIVQNLVQNRWRDDEGETFDSFEMEAQTFGSTAVNKFYALKGWDRYAHLREAV